MATLFLAVVGSLYIFLGAWCAVSPGTTSKTVGFQLTPGAGQSEFLTVYGGLEVALGLAFLAPLWGWLDVSFSLRLCLLLHACLVLFRTASLVIYSGLPATTYAFAAVDWLILALTA